MGNESSTLAGDPYPDSRDDYAIEGGEFCGFRVLGIQDQSPASSVGFVSFFDFILEANGIRLDTRDATLMELIAQSEDRPMQLRVYNVKAQTSRDLQLTPSRKWPGKGLLGVTIRFDSYDGAEDQLLHVLSVVESSPAERAGLRADSDYLLGTPERVFDDADDLHDAILDALDGSFQCYVYNSLEDQVRIVSIVPTERWGGDGVLGAEVGQGCLHRLPSVCRNTIGSSVGFVNLPKYAKAATDAFLKPQRCGEDSQVSSGDCEEAGIEAAKLDSIVSLKACETTQQTALEQYNQEDDTGSVSSTPQAKPRYTARMDLQFPISTVAVLADP